MENKTQLYNFFNLACLTHYFFPRKDLILIFVRESYFIQVLSEKVYQYLLRYFTCYFNIVFLQTDIDYVNSIFSDNILPLFISHIFP